MIKLNEKTKKILDEMPAGMQRLELGILPLVNAFNNLDGIITVSSCEGHDNQYPYVYFGVDGSKEALASLCLISHSIKPFFWRLIACPLGSSGDIYIRFYVTPPKALKETIVDQPSFLTRTNNPVWVKEAQKDIPEIVNHLKYIAKRSKFIPELS